MKTIGSLETFWLLALSIAVVVPYSNGASPVKLSVYMETLCPDCREFYVNQTYPVWQDLKDIMEVDINFYGKATEAPSPDVVYNFTCQHGWDECQGNMLMACANRSMPIDTYITFGDCIMRVFNSTGGGQECSDLVGVDYLALEACWSGGYGRYLLHEMGEKQRKLDPQLNYVPWILINDVYSSDQSDAAQKDLRKVICDAYTGDKPARCNS